MSRVTRLARSSDAAGIAAIYAPIVRDTTISFESEPPTADEMAARIETVLLDLPWIVCTEDGRLAGYAYATRYRSRAAYQWTVEVSVYVHVDHRGSGVGREPVPDS